MREKMKGSLKPISSPRRAEKFPPPLMRFLRSNVGSRSRGRSRSSPMFVRKKSNTNTVIETQEPSSPKVTCIGQVRVRRSSKQKPGSITGRSKTSPAKNCHCWCLRKPSFSHHFFRKIKPRSFLPHWSKWVFFFRFGYCKKPKTENFSTVESNRQSVYRATDTKYEYNDDELEEAPEIFVGPPKNALLLTRCRSAPYRSSSLASQFWGSPLLTSEETGDDEAEKALEQQEDRDEGRPTSEDEPDCRYSTAESRTDREIDGNLGIPQEIDGKIEGISSSIGPLLLTRCKSEPARTGERLNPRSGFAETCSPNGL